MTPPDRTAQACWLLAILLTALFVNSFPVWTSLSRKLGSAAALLPFGAFLLLLAALLPVAWRRRPWSGRAALGALAMAALGLLLADPDFPAKRIHVAEYALLALVLRRALAPLLAGHQLLLATITFGLLCGLHDEMLQGLLPSRSYGLRDVLVDGCGAAAGALLAQALRLMPGQAKAALGNLPLTVIPLGVSILLLALAMPAFDGQPVPLWTAAPLLCSIGALLLTSEPAGAERPLLRLLLLFTAPLALYPVLSHVPPLVFR